MTKMDSIKFIMDRIYTRLHRDHLKKNGKSKINIKKLEFRNQSMKIEHECDNIYYHGRGNILLTFFLNKDYKIKYYKVDMVGMVEKDIFQTTLDDLKNMSDKELLALSDNIYNTYINPKSLLL